MDEPTDFWSYSLDVYSRPGVASACLALQEELDIDVNVLLYCCWHGMTRGVVNDRDFAAVLEFTGNWSSALVKPLRSARSWLKNEGCDHDEIPREDCEALRKSIKAAELASERLQQIAMESLSAAPTEHPQPESARTKAALHNISSYLRALGATVSDESRANLAAVISGIDPEVDPASIADKLQVRHD